MNIETTPSSDSDSFDFTYFGDRLRWALARKEMRQSDLGIKVGLTKGAVSQHCLSKKPTGGGKKVVQMAEVLEVNPLWLQFGIPRGETPKVTAPLVRSAMPRSSTEFGGELSVLQEATLQNLAKVMAAGDFDDLACLELLHQLKPSLAKLAAVPTTTEST